MSRLGPIITLVAGAAVAAGLGVASVTTAPAAQEQSAAAVAEPTTEVTSAATPEPTAAPSIQKVKADYAGRVTGNGGLIAISVRDGKAVGYFCDGKTEAWFKGTAADGAVKLAGFGDARLSAAFGGGKAKGKLSLSGKSWTFTAPTVVKPSGLYRATQLVRGAKIKAGWIVLKNPDGNGFTRVGTAYVDDKQVATPELTPGQPVTLNGVQIQPKDVDGFIEEMS